MTKKEHLCVQIEVKCALVPSRAGVEKFPQKSWNLDSYIVKKGGYANC